ncbi:cytidylyltransferase domain-containing protein [Nitrosopumilus sp.]|uniref:acylneuraminate cytidylyltransferase family protein n=1 Tax=Nitrosopumilus sp. TaxID=2024843 RepID=UPI003D130354
MKILSIIPARGGSKGLKNKNIRLLLRKPILQYSIESSQKSKYVTKTIVTTDDQKISSIAKKLNCQVIIRPKKLATNKAKLEPVISHVLQKLKIQENYIPDVIILLQNTSPLRNHIHIDQAVRKFLRNDFTSLLSVYRSHSFLWQIRKNGAIPLNYNPKNRPNRQDMNSEFLENGAIYITKYSAFLKSKCRISGKIGLYVMNSDDSVQIDSLEELEIIKKIIKNRKSG